MLTEIAAGVFRIESVFGGRLLYVYLFRGDDFTLLIDSGASVTPREVILPALASLEVEPDLLLVTHCDLDHQGGNAAIRGAFPTMTIACGAGDEEQIGDPRTLVAKRYSGFEYDHGVGFPTDVKPRLVELAGGRAVPVDRTFCGGERLRLSDDWLVEILHLPGHSKGHLGVFDPRSRLAVTQDAVHGSDYPFADGRPWALMPTYYYIEPYLKTVEQLRSLNLAALHTAHWPAAEGGDVGKHLDATRTYTLEADRTIFGLIEEGTSTVKELMDTALPLLGKWDPSVAGDFACSVYGHVERFVDAGLVGGERRDGRLHYHSVKDYEAPHQGG
ncbi:MAG: MBL fold metallo-hydrolase [Actinomycetota bacterium]|nr:MBL fold metallo-hydrolase [Actinomycetota bacterium]